LHQKVVSANIGGDMFLKIYIILALFTATMVIVDIIEKVFTVAFDMVGEFLDQHFNGY